MTDETQTVSTSRGWIRPIILLLLLLIGLTVISTRTILAVYKVKGSAMEPGLSMGDRVIGLRWMGQIERGDIVSFTNQKPGQAPKTYLKRVIGLPGETISIQNGQVFIDGDPLEEKYVDRKLKDNQSILALNIPEGSFYLLGDRRWDSYDSRSYGAVPRKSIISKVVWP